MLLRLGIWLSAGLVGFALIIWSCGHSSFGYSFIEAGSSIFTLGFATESHAAPEVVAFLAAAFGLLVIALRIAYLPAPLRLVQPPRDARHHAREPGRHAGVGTGAVGPSLPGGQPGQPGRLLRRVGTVGGRRGREPHDLPGADLHALAPSDQLLARRSRRRPRLGRPLHGPLPGGRPGRGSALRPHGLHRSARHRPGHPHPLRPRPPPRRRHRARLRRIRSGPDPPGTGRCPLRAPGRGGVAPFQRVARQLRSHRLRPHRHRLRPPGGLEWGAPLRRRGRRHPRLPDGPSTGGPTPPRATGSTPPVGWRPPTVPAPVRPAARLRCRSTVR
jgi:hypothetical protein